MSALSNKQTQPGNETVVIQAADFTPSTATQQKKSKFSLWHALLALTLLITLCVVGFILFARSLVVSITPMPEHMQITGGLKFEINDHYLMLPGDYQLTASLPGYYPIAQPFVVGDAQNQSLTLALQPLPGRLFVDAAGIAGQVKIADIVAETGTVIEDIPAGIHSLTIEAARYKPYVDEITIEGKEVQQLITVELQPNWADVLIDSQPRGATLYSNGEIIGQTPLKAELLAGQHQISLSLSGYKSWQQSLSVDALQQIDLGNIELKKLDGGIEISSNPAGASVTISGNYVGTTPLAMALTPDKSYTISLFKDGFEPVEQTVSIASDKTQQLAVTLPPLLAKIAIKAIPADSLLYVDNVLMGRANQTITLTAKAHLIRIEKNGYVPHNAEFVAQVGQNQQLDVRLKTLEQAKWENIAYNITSPAGTPMKLFIPKQASFVMGASRREQGRRANEAQRSVALTRPFYFSSKEVTNAEFRQFRRLHSSSHVNGNSLNNDEWPVVNVTWQDAALYCNWLSEQENLPVFYQVTDGKVSGFNADSNGYRLPTEAEWAWLARFNGKKDSKYAWGDELPPVEGSGNLGDRSAAALLGQIQVSYNDQFIATAPVASFAADVNGLYDLSGNVAEWVHDFYEIQTGLSLKTAQDPLGPEQGQHHVIRGTSWRHGSMIELRQAFRDYGEDKRDDVGFRVARYVD